MSSNVLSMFFVSAVNACHTILQSAQLQIIHTMSVLSTDQDAVGAVLPVDSASLCLFVLQNCHLADFVMTACYTVIHSDLHVCTAFTVYHWVSLYMTVHHCITMYY